MNQRPSPHLKNARPRVVETVLNHKPIFASHLRRISIRRLALGLNLVMPATRKEQHHFAISLLRKVVVVAVQIQDLPCLLLHPIAVHHQKQVVDFR